MGLKVNPIRPCRGPPNTGAGFEPAEALIYFGLQYFKVSTEYVRSIRPLCQPAGYYP